MIFQLGMKIVIPIPAYSPGRLCKRLFHSWHISVEVVFGTEETLNLCFEVTSVRGPRYVILETPRRESLRIYKL